ncbi:MAG TPA: S41 family peptidase [Thermoanaerobaculia bacterium]|nr:S41 family peptidase [Thermoanaerobaculia bacterium]
MRTSARWLSRTIWLGLLALLLPGSSASAQRPPDIPLNAGMNREIVEGVLKAIDRYYVSHEVARKIDESLRRRLQAGEYDRITSAFDLVDALDAHMQEVSKDRHLAMGYSHRPEPLDEGNPFPPETPQEREEARTAAIEANFGFEKVERLPGNIGYLDIRKFIRPELSGDMTGVVMTFLANTDAMILDLRNSQGGSLDMVVFLASYFFGGDEPFHLGGMYSRAENMTQQFWTSPYVPGRRYRDKDLYILLSKKTFSAPEGFAAFLQHHKRATVVGERTAGGTHPGRFVRVHPNFAVFVPMGWPVYPAGTPAFPIGRPVYPASKADERGTGVTPDLELPADQALKAAHLAAVKRKLERDPSQKERLEPILDGLKKELEALTPRP